MDGPRPRDKERSSGRGHPTHAASWRTPGRTVGPRGARRDRPLPSRARLALRVGLLLLASLGLAGCPTDCEVACGKFEYCTLLPGLSRTACLDRCEEASEDLARICSDCLDNTSCGTIASGACDEGCDPIFPMDDGEEEEEG